MDKGTPMARHARRSGFRLAIIACVAAAAIIVLIILATGGGLGPSSRRSATEVAAESASRDEPIAHNGGPLGNTPAAAAGNGQPVQPAPSNGEQEPPDGQQSPHPPIARHAAEPVPAAVAERVASRFAQHRWKGCTMGPSVLACAPDGTPEAYFFIVFLPGSQRVRLTELQARIATVQKERAELERKRDESSPAESAGIDSRIKTLWAQMRGDDTYATVVVGANEGREPFIASFGGLPPPLVLRDDAITLRRQQLGGQDPGEPKVIWLPPLFVFFEFEAKAGGPGVWLEARGTELAKRQPLAWQRPVLPNDVLAQRRQKWTSFRENGHE